jgi:hypothetical protein
MLRFLRLHTLAATRGDGLRPELRILFERLAEASEGVSNVAIADDRHLAVVISGSSSLASDRETFGERNPKP